MTRISIPMRSRLTSQKKRMQVPWTPAASARRRISISRSFPHYTVLNCFVPVFSTLRSTIRCISSSNSTIPCTEPLLAAFPSFSRTHDTQALCRPPPLVLIEGQPKARLKAIDFSAAIEDCLVRDAAASTISLAGHFLQPLRLAISSLVRWTLLQFSHLLST
jgi:hypothetical protein